MNITTDTILCGGLYEINESSGYNGVINVLADGVNLTCNGTELKGNSVGYGILNNGYVNTVIKDCTLTKYNWGIILNYANDSIIKNNNINNITGYSLYIYDAINIQVDGNSISNSSTGVYTELVSESTFKNNIFNDNQLGAFSIRESSNHNLISNNTVNKLGGETLLYSIFTVDSINNTLLNNTIRDTYRGLAITNSVDNTVTGNIITNVDQYGIVLASTSASLVHANIVNGSSSTTNNCIQIQETSQTNFITNNTFYQCEYGTYVYNSTDDHNFIYYNNFTANTKAHAYSVSGADNDWNTTVSGAAHGNFWDDVAGLTITDSDADGFGDGGANYPYNSTNGGNVTGPITDWGPII